MHYVYLIEATDLVEEGKWIESMGIPDFDSHMCKIGISSNPKKRLRQLRTGSPSCLELLWTYEVESAKVAEWVEQWLHRMFARYRVRGEWYRLLTYDAHGGMEEHADWLLSDDFDEETAANHCGTLGDEEIYD